MKAITIRQPWASLIVHGIKEVKIECPECGSIEIAVEDYTTAPFAMYLHSCNKCGHVIMESEWEVINKEE